MIPSRIVPLSFFVDSFVRSMPTGKITTFANRTLPDAVLVQVRNDQPINMAGAFEDPIIAGQHGFAEPAVKRFVEFESKLRDLTGLEPVGSLATWTTPRGEAFSALGTQVRLSIWEVRRWMLCEASNEFGTRLATGWPHAVVGLIQSIHAQIDGGFSHEKRTGRSARGGAGTQAQRSDRGPGRASFRRAGRPARAVAPRLSYGASG